MCCCVASVHLLESECFELYINLCPLVIVHLTSYLFVFGDNWLDVHLFLYLFAVEVVDVCAFFGSVQSLKYVRHLLGVVLLLDVLRELLVRIQVLLVPVAVTVLQLHPLHIVSRHYAHYLLIV